MAIYNDTFNLTKSEDLGLNITYSKNDIDVLVA